MNKLTIIWTLCVTFVAMTKAQKEYIPQVARKLGLTTYVEKLEEFELDESFSRDDELTIFGPTNAAFENLKPPYDKLYATHKAFVFDTLRYNAYRGILRSSDLRDELTIETLNEQSARVNLYPKGQASFEVATMQCAPIDLSRVDQPASNGVIHVLNAVMIPPFKNILEVFKRDMFKNLAKFVKTTRVDADLAGTNPLTFFAPSDDAFAKLPAGVVQGIIDTTGAMRNVMLGHVVNGTYCSVGLTSGPLTTLNGQDVQITVTADGIKVNDANVVQPDCSATNGVVHRIDKVLLP